MQKDLIPMAKHFGMTVTPGPRGGALTGKYIKGDKGRYGQCVRLNDRSTGITKVIKIADELAAGIAGCAKVTMQKVSIHSIVGATKLPQLMENLQTVSVSLSSDQINRQRSGR
jgi:aryl-alcohol dehydrogenase-like predicted oxidoreductase